MLTRNNMVETSSTGKYAAASRQSLDTLDYKFLKAHRIMKCLDFSAFNSKMLQNYFIVQKYIWLTKMHQ